MSFADFFTPETVAQTRARFYGWAKAAGLILTNFIKGSVPDQLVESCTQAANNAAVQASQVIRGRASLDTATDPGDFDPYDPTNAAAPPAPGYLSDYGAGINGTRRNGSTFATGTFTIDNTLGPSAISFAPGKVAFTRDSNFTGKTYAPTYLNDADPSVYVNADGTVTVPAGATLDIPIIADEIGTASNAGAGHVSLVTVLGSGVTGTNAADIIGQDREDADAYRARCRTAPATISANGAAGAYESIALSARVTPSGTLFFIPAFGDGVTGFSVDDDGAPVLLANAVGELLGATRVYVEEDTPDGNVAVWIATADGAPSGGDSGTIVLGVKALCDAWIRPQCNTVTYKAAINTTLTVTGTVKAKKGAGVTAQAVADAIAAALEAASPGWDIGGYDRTAGAGTIYLEEVVSTVNGAHPAIYLVTLSSPSGNTALAKGHVAQIANNINAGNVTVA